MVSISAIKTNTDTVILKIDEEYEIELTEVAFVELAKQLTDFVNPENVIASWFFDPAEGDN